MGGTPRMEPLRKTQAVSLSTSTLGQAAAVGDAWCPAC